MSAGGTLRMEIPAPSPRNALPAIRTLPSRDAAPASARRSPVAGPAAPPAEPIAPPSARPSIVPMLLVVLVVSVLAGAGVAFAWLAR